MKITINNHSDLGYQTTQKFEGRLVNEINSYALIRNINGKSQILRFDPHKYSFKILLDTDEATLYFRVKNPLEFDNDVFVGELDIKEFTESK